MKHPDFDKAFAPTPEIVSLSIEAAFRKGEKAMKFRHKLTAVLSAAAVLVIICAAAVFALPDEPRPDVIGQPQLTNAVTAPEETGKVYSSSVSYDAEGNIIRMENEPLPTAAPTPPPMPTAEASPTEEPALSPAATAAATPEPTPQAEGFIGWENEETVWYNVNGHYYHFDEHCSGMQGAQPHSTTERLRDGKKPCPVCVMDEEEVVVYRTEKGKYYHYYMHCSGMMNAFADTVNESLNAGKDPCPVCVLGNGSSDWTVYPAPTPSTETTFVLTDEQPTPAGRASDIFLNVFGVYLFDAFEDYEYISTQAQGITGSGGVVTEEIEFCFAKDGLQFTPVRVTIESQNAKILSGSICLAPDADFGFDWTSFCERSSAWYQKVCGNVPSTLDMLTAMDAAFEDQPEGITQLCAYFDSNAKPSVCSVELTTYFGFFTLSFDISDNGDVSLASMNYNVSKA